MKNISALIDQLKYKNINDLQKETLLNLINLYDSLDNEIFLDKLIFKLNEVENNIPNFDNTKILILNYRIDSILSSLNKKSYIKKEIKKNYSIYEYENFWLIFIAVWEEKILNELEFIKQNEKEIYWKIKGKFALISLNDINKKLKNKSDITLKIFK